MTGAGVRVPTVAVDLRCLVATPTGIGFYTLSMLEALSRRGAYRLLGLAHARPQEGDRLAAAGIAVETSPAPFGVWWQQLVLPRRLRQPDVDLLWSPISVLPVDLPVPSVVTVHDLTPLLFPETHRLKVRWSVYPFLQRTLERARVVVADSEATARDLRFHFPQCRERVRVIYPGIDAVFRPGDMEAVQAVREDLGCPDGYILYAGTLEPRKNVGLLLDAWTRLRADDPKVPPLLLAGPPGWQSRRLHGRLAALEPLGLRHLGRLSRRRFVEVIQGARVFVYPSLYEGFGLPPAEALACGVPTVVSEASSLPELVGDAGLCVDPEDPGALAGAILRLLSDPALADELAQRGRQRAARFRWDRAAAQMEEAFDRAGAAG